MESHWQLASWEYMYAASAFSSSREGTVAEGGVDSHPVKLLVFVLVHTQTRLPACLSLH